MPRPLGVGESLQGFPGPPGQGGAGVGGPSPDDLLCPQAVELTAFKVSGTTLPPQEAPLFPLPCSPTAPGWKRLEKQRTRLPTACGALPLALLLAGAQSPPLAHWGPVRKGQCSLGEVHSGDRFGTPSQSGRCRRGREPGACLPLRTCSVCPPPRPSALRAPTLMPPGRKGLSKPGEKRALPSQAPFPNHRADGGLQAVG